jgi:hypothetical protein
MAIHRFPALARLGAPVGQHPQVPTPGKEEKKVGDGGSDYKTGKRTDLIADTKWGARRCWPFSTVLLRT